MLAILARSGQYLLVCLTFGPTNGPEDFAFATDRVYAPGRGRKMRFCTNWQIYADDITVRSGRWLNGIYHSDSERAEALRKAQLKSRADQTDIEGSFRALGFDPSPLGADQKPTAKTKAKAKARKEKGPQRPKTEKEEAQSGLTSEATAFPSPYAHGRFHRTVAYLTAFVCLALLAMIWRQMTLCVSVGSRSKKGEGTLEKQNKSIQSGGPDLHLLLGSFGFPRGVVRSSGPLPKLPIRSVIYVHMNRAQS